MPISAECSQCGRIYEAHDPWADRHFRCPNCDATMAVPTPPGYERLCRRAAAIAGGLRGAAAWRGENGNPGSFEMCYGEVTDAAAALDYLAVQSDMDPARLYAAGHSVGGAIVMLLSAVGQDRARANHPGRRPLQRLSPAIQQAVGWFRSLAPNRGGFLNGVRFLSCI